MRQKLSIIIWTFIGYLVAILISIVANLITPYVELKLGTSIFDFIPFRRASLWALGIAVFVIIASMIAERIAFRIANKAEKNTLLTDLFDFRERRQTLRITYERNGGKLLPGEYNDFNYFGRRILDIKTQMLKRNIPFVNEENDTLELPNAGGVRKVLWHIKSILGLLLSFLLVVVASFAGLQTPALTAKLIGQFVPLPAPAPFPAQESPTPSVTTTATAQVASINTATPVITLSPTNIPTIDPTFTSTSNPTVTDTVRPSVTSTATPNLTVTGEAEGTRVALVIQLTLTALPTPIPTVTPDITASAEARRAEVSIAVSATIEALQASTATSVVATQITTPTLNLTPIETFIVTPTLTITPTGQESDTIPLAELTGQLAYTVLNGRTGNFDTKIYNFTSKTTTLLTGKRQPDFSNSGYLLVNGEGASENSIMRITAVETKPVSEHPEDSYPQWSPSNQSFVYASQLQGDNTWRIYLQPDSDRQQVGDTLYYGTREIFGSYPLYVHENRVAYKGCDSWQGGSRCGIYVVDTSGGQPYMVMDGTDNIPSDSYGNRIYVTSNIDSNWDIYVVDIANPLNEQRLTDSPAREGLPAISPDGQYMAYVSDADGVWSIFIADSDGDGATKLLDVSTNYGTGDKEWFNERLSWGP